MTGIKSRQQEKETGKEERSSAAAAATAGVVAGELIEIDGRRSEAGRLRGGSRAKGAKEREREGEWAQRLPDSPEHQGSEGRSTAPGIRSKCQVIFSPQNCSHATAAAAERERQQLMAFAIIGMIIGDP